MLDQLTDSERSLKEAVSAGRSCDFPANGDVESGGSWGPERTVRAVVLRDLLTTPVGAHDHQPPPLELTWARIAGTLNLADRVMVRPLILKRCFLDQGIALDHAIVPRVNLEGCGFPSLSGRQLETRGDLRLDGVVCGEVGLTGARIGGVLSLNGTRLDINRGVVVDADQRPIGRPVAFDGDRLDVRVEMDCTGLEATGEVRLSGAHIAGRLNFEAATLTNEDGPALTADGLHVEQDMLCREPDPPSGKLKRQRQGEMSEMTFDVPSTKTPARGQPTRRFTAHGELRLVGARIGGQLNFGGAELSHEGERALSAGGLHVEQDMLCRARERSRFKSTGELHLLGAHIGGQLDFGGAELSNDGEPALTADGLRVEQDMLLTARNGRPFEASGELRLAGAHVGGTLNLDDARLTNGDGVALDAGALRVDREMLCGNGFTAHGNVELSGAHLHAVSFAAAGYCQTITARGVEVARNLSCDDFAGDRIDLRGAHIGGVLFLDRASLAGDLDAEGVRVDEDMYCRKFRATKGDVNLRGAQIGEQLSLESAHIGGRLKAEGVRVADDMLCEKLTVAGEVRLGDAHIGRRLSFNGATMRVNQSLHLNALRTDGALSLLFDRQAPNPAGPPHLIDLTGAHIGALIDSDATWPANLKLRDCEYTDLKRSEQPPLDVEKRLEWIALSEASDGYSTQPYTQLIACCRRQGRDSDARDVAYARERRRRGQLGRLGRAWNVFLQSSVGYGYRPLRALGWFLVLVLAGTFAFHHYHDTHRLVALKSTTAHQPFDAFIYTVDRMIPVVSLGLRDAFAAHGAAQWLAAGYTVLGWLLTIAIAAGVTAAARRD